MMSTTTNETKPGGLMGSLRNILHNPSSINSNNNKNINHSGGTFTNTAAPTTTTTTTTTNSSSAAVTPDIKHSLTTENMKAEESSGDNNPPRKRTKVSRACDACRRKKVRCDGEYSSTLQRVSKICNNCTKNNEECTFSRVPLKRGPSKGYIRDLEDKAEHNDGVPTQQHPQQHHNGGPLIGGSTVRPISGSLGGSGPVPVSTFSHQPLVFAQSHLNQQQQQLPITLVTSSSPPIKLPPLLGFQSKVFPSTTQRLTSSSSVPTVSSSNPSSPTSHGLTAQADQSSVSTIIPTPGPATNAIETTQSATNAKPNSPPIQGPFWKVPYEMPQSASSRKSSISSATGHGGSRLRRKSSIDSISSTSTTGSRLPSLKPSVSMSSDFMSDSESEDYYSIRSGASHSQFPPVGASRKDSMSPRNSIASMSSLNGRMNKTLNFQSSASTTPVMVGSPLSAAGQTQYFVQQQQNMYAGQHPLPVPPMQPSFQIGGHMPIQSPAPRFSYPQQGFVYPPTSIPVNLLETNLKLYYDHFHSSFPILPFNSTMLASLSQARDESAAHVWVIEMFNRALNNLNNFKQVNLNENIELLLRLMSSYPFLNLGINMNDTSLIFFFSTILIINYAILLNGDVYSSGISWSSSIFNDYKVVQKFVEFVGRQKGNNMSNSVDLDRIELYLSKLYLSLDVIDNINSISTGSQKNVGNNTMIQFLYSNSNLLMNENDESIKSGLTVFKNSQLFSQLINIRDQFILSFGNYTQPIQIAITQSNDEFSSYFVTLINEKYDLINYLFEMNAFLKDSIDHDPEEVYENLMDYNLKLIRLVKKISNSIMHFANYIGTSTASSSASTSPTSEQSKKSENKVLMNPLLNISIGQLFKLIKLNKLLIDSLSYLNQSTEHLHAGNRSSATDLSGRLSKINNDLSISFNLLNLNLVNLQLGTKSNAIIRKKINDYNFNFNLQNMVSNNETKLDIKLSLNNWFQEFTTSILPFIHLENTEGWY